MTAITIGVVDDHPLFREGVTRSLSEISGFIVVGEGASSDDAAMIASDNHPDIMLLDVSMPGGGLSAISDVLARSPTTKVLMLTVSEEVDTLLGALQRGAMGYVLKGVGSRGLAEAIQTVLRGSRYISPTMSAKVMENSLHGGTPEKKQPDATGTRGDGSCRSRLVKQAYRLASQPAGKDCEAPHDPDSEQARRLEQD